MRILHTADLHLRDNADVRWRGLQSIIDTTREADVDVLVIAGDLFDRDADADILRPLLRNVFTRCPAQVLIIPGNHDVRGLRSGDFYGDNVTVMAGAGALLDIDNVRFVGLPFEEADVEMTARRFREAAALRRDGASNILIAHCELMDLVPESGAWGDESGRNYMPVRLATVAGTGFDYVLAGHFHRSWRALRAGQTHFVYSGSPVSIKKGETGRRHATILVPGEAPTALPLDTHHFVEITVDLTSVPAAKAIETIRSAVPEAHPLADVTLKLSGFINLAELSMNEEMFVAALAEVRSDCNLARIDSLWRDASEIFSHPLYRKLMGRLSEKGLSATELARARAMAATAFMESSHAR